LNSSAFIENLPSSEGARARARANHARNDAQKGCVMQLNGITQRRLFTARKAFWSQTGSARHLPLELELCTSLLCFVEREIIQVE